MTDTTGDFDIEFGTSNCFGELPADMRIIRADQVRPGMVLHALIDVCGDGTHVLESPGYSGVVDDTKSRRDGRIVFYINGRPWDDTEPDWPVGVTY